MPLRLHVGLQQKVELPNDADVMASCHVELELSRNLIDRDPESFQREVEQAFDACRYAVSAELARQQQPVQTDSNTSDCPTAFHTNGYARPSHIRVLRLNY